MIKMLLGTNNGEGKKDTFFIQYDEWVIKADKSADGEFDFLVNYPYKSIEELCTFLQISENSKLIASMSPEQTDVGQQALYHFLLLMRRQPELLKNGIENYPSVPTLFI